MAAPVWVLSVDLQAKTATFQSGLADAAKAARGSFNDIGGGASGMGRSVGYSMGEARHSVMLLGEEFGVHLPRALATFIAGLGPIGAALEAAFPFLAVIVGATMLIEHLQKLREAGVKLTDDQVRFGTAVNNAFNALDEKLIQARIKSDELRNDHLGALRLQLELIDKQSMVELVHSFEEVAKSADVVMKDLEGHWYTFGVGSDGAKNALDQFQTQYENLMSQGKDSEASGLLAGTLKQAKHILDLQKEVKANGGGIISAPGPNADVWLAMEDEAELKKNNVGLDNSAIAAQEQLVSVLQKQVEIESRVSALKNMDKGNAKGAEGNGAAAQNAAAARQSAESMQRMGEQSLAADKATAEAALTIHRASLEQRLTSEMDFAGRDRDLKEAANQAEIAALDKSGKDYQNQLKALNDKALEITNEYDTKIAELKAKSSVEVYNRDLQALEQSEREKTEATRQGSDARLAAIGAALQTEQAHNLQDTNFFRELLNQRVETLRQEAEEEGKLRQEASREDADNTEKTGTLSIQAEKQRVALEDSARRTSAQQRIAQDIQIANEEYTLKMSALDKEIAGLDKSGKEYENKLKALQDKEKQATRQHENEITSIKEKAEQERNQRIMSSEHQLAEATSSGLTQSIMGHQTWARTLESLGDQVVSGAIKNSLMILMQQDKERLGDARTAAANSYSAVSAIPIVGPFIAPVAAAGAFAAVLAFDNGTDRVPGVGRGDIVPSMLSPGEGVVPGGVMDGLRNVARNGGFDQHPSMTVHVRPTYHVSTIDGDGMRATLEKHTDQLQHHFEGVIRKMNR
jgi:hypothetical protein